MPVLKISPIDGKSLDSSKTPEQIAKEQSEAEKYYKERKKRILTGKKKKKVEITEDVQVTVNPFTAKNNDPTVDELIEPFNDLLSDCEKYLKNMTKSYKIVKSKNNTPFELVLNRVNNRIEVVYNSDYSTNTHIPKHLEYRPNYTTIPKKDDVFLFNKEYTTKLPNILVDRLLFNILDIKQLLNNPKEAKLVLQQLMTTALGAMISTKFLKSGNKYTGTTVASIEIPGQKGKYALNYRDECIEVRLWSDITDVI